MHDGAAVAFALGPPNRRVAPCRLPLLVALERSWLPRPPPGTVAIANPRDERRLVCDLGDKTQLTMYLGLFEPSETRLVRELLTPRDTFVDIGAHIGWFTTIASACVGRNGRVVAFEPYGSNASALKENLLRNDCANVELTETALGSSPGTLTLAKAGGDSRGVTALDWAYDGKVDVPVVTLDDARDDLGEVTLLKIDVEGWEAHVLRGAARTLQHAAYVLIEINRQALEKAGSSQEEIFALLRTAGFASFIHIDEGAFRRYGGDLVSNVLATRFPEPLRARSAPDWGVTRRTSRRLHVDADPLPAAR